jgi:hypothetical protein
MSKPVKFNFRHYLDREEEEGVVELLVTGTYSYDPGRLSGPPEDCYPPEEELEYTMTYNGGEFPDEALTAKERDRIEDEIREYVRELEDDCDEEPDYDYEND